MDTTKLTTYKFKNIFDFVTLG